MKTVFTIHRPLTRKTKNLRLLPSGGPNAEQLDKIRRTAEYAHNLEKFCAKLVQKSGKVKRACKEIHGLIEKGYEETNQKKKKAYAEKINRKIKAIENDVVDWSSDLTLWGNQIPKGGTYWDGGAFDDFTSETLGFQLPNKGQ